jgi:3-oxoacyl-[acyl-carrier-protein] synthase II
VSSPARTPVIRSWSAISTLGIGPDAHRSGLLTRALPEADPTDAFATEHGGRAAVIPSFPVRTLLGKKGTRSLDRVTALAVATVGGLVTGDPTNVAPFEADSPVADRGLVLGTTTGSAQSMMDFTRSTFDGEKPFFVDPAKFPNTVMNCAAGRAAIWFQLRGPNATVGGGRVAGLHALNYSRRLLLTGRAETVLCGAAEEHSTARADLRALTDPDDTTRLGEGCAVVEIGGPEGGPESGPGLAEILGVRFGVARRPEDAHEVLADCVRRTLHDTRVAPGDVWAHLPSRSGGTESEAVTSVLGTDFRTHTCDDLLGDTSAAAAMFAVVAALVHAAEDDAAAGRIALITAIDPTGAVGCALLRPLPTS